LSRARALESGTREIQDRSDREALERRLATLTEREKAVMERMAKGEMTKNIAAALGISQRTAEHHRQSILRKMDAKSLAILVRMLALHEAGR
jgi:FixJ family two-component response regulator